MLIKSRFWHHSNTTRDSRGDFDSTSHIAPVDTFKSRLADMPNKDTERKRTKADAEHDESEKAREQLVGAETHADLLVVFGITAVTVILLARYFTQR